MGYKQSVYGNIMKAIIAVNSLHPSNCDPVHMRMPSFEDLHIQLAEATNVEHMSDFTCDVVIAMYDFLHCTNYTREDAVGILQQDDLFPRDQVTCTDPVVCDVVIGMHNYLNCDHITRDNARAVLGANHGNTTFSSQCPPHPADAVGLDITGKHIRAVTSANQSPVVSPKDQELMYRMIANATAETSPACLQWLIECYRATCTVCDELDCLLEAHVQHCDSPVDSSYCITTVRDTSSGRHISRNCTSKSYCDDKLQGLSPDCDDVEDKKLPDRTTCYFCCQGDNCNRPPLMKSFSGSYTVP
ncbi:hypothetical protein BaRGS_00026168 [Batillaria attramentaria]|uniref:Uncharacterized protein n=1 Tax=Batillaria attramentaria TaxID=370345 RepID=A0ABD0K6X6_9CAEN